MPRFQSQAAIGDLVVLLHGGFVTVDTIFGSIRRGHLDLINHVKQGVDWDSIPEEIRYHWVHRQIARMNGLYPVVSSVIQGTDTLLMTSMIGRTAPA